MCAWVKPNPRSKVKCNTLSRAICQDQPLEAIRVLVTCTAKNSDFYFLKN